MGDASSHLSYSPIPFDLFFNPPEDLITHPHILFTSSLSLDDSRYQSVFDRLS